MRLHRVRHFRFAGNAVTTRILRRLQVQTTSSSRPSVVSPNSVWRSSPLRSSISSGSDAPRTTCSASAGVTPCLAMWALLASSQSKAGGLAPGIYLKCIPIVHIRQEGCSASLVAFHARLRYPVASESITNRQHHLKQATCGRQLEPHFNLERDTLQVRTSNGPRRSATLPT